ncbi:MAG: carboxypeptidase-like regulatory domain-containing protein [Bacteroidales bacterium]|nr:carboxypeptidase-like regulatory domain-containing protein [Bacteroidales bacterium]
MKKLSLIFAALLLSAAMFAQGLGGITAAVVSRDGRVPVQGAQVHLLQGGILHWGTTSNAAGKFLFKDLDNGGYELEVSAEGYVTAHINVVVEDGLVRDLMFVTLTPKSQVADVDDSNYSEFDLQDSGYSDTPTILYSGNNDVYSNIVSYGFSPVRYKNRGYNSETQDVLLAGVRMNDAITGYSPFSLWSGLNEAMRSKDTTNGLESSDASLGGYNGVTNIAAVPSSVRTGLRASVLTNSALYRLRLMLTYASGVLDNGWSFAVNASARVGGNDWVKGVYYKSLAIYAGAEKRFNSSHSLALFAFATPGERGAQNASTQEVYNLMGDNMYNSNWGYQNGKVRNARVRRTFEPVVGLKYNFTPSKNLSGFATLLWRTGRNGYTALDWYDAMDPRPDYYRNLPSYFKMEDSDYNRNNLDKSEWAEYAWTKRGATYDPYQHVNWDRMYNVNYRQADGRSKYVVEDRHVDQNDINFAASVKWLQSSHFTLTGGLDAKINITENYKKIDDLLGGQYYLNVDQFAERDFASSEALIQNDLDYFLANGSAQKILKGGKYGYDYLAHIRKENIWANGILNFGHFTANVGLTLGHEGFWREGLVRKGLFAGLDDNGKEIVYEGKTLTSYDSKGEVISSKGKSKRADFLTYSAKVGAAYIFDGGHRISANAGYFNNAPTFNQSFISARTRNSMVDNLTTSKIFSSDLNYQYNHNGYSVRVTGYFTTINDLTKVMSFYDDSQQSFTNFAMTGIAERHAGIEVGAKIPLPVTGLSISGVLAWGEHIYTKNPHMVQTVDNSAEIIRDEDVPYWMSSPIYKKIQAPDGRWILDEDVDGNPIVLGNKKHYVPSTPQLAAELAINYNIDYWFFEINGQFFAKSYLDMNPLYRTHFACAGGDGIETPDEIDYMTTQEEFAPAFLLNASIGKSWYIQRKYQLGFSANIQNITNNRNVKTGGYEQTRLIKSEGRDRYYRFDPKYFYMQGINYMLNIYFRF